MTQSTLLTPPEQRTQIFNPQTETHIDVWFETITPSKAQTLLENMHTNQRTASNATIQTYARNMKNGDWHATVDSLQFVKRDNGTEELSNGQHRLHGVIASETDVIMMCLSGVEAESFQAMDNGKMRGLADALEVAGYNRGLPLKPAQVAAIIKQFMHLETAFVNNTHIEAARRHARATNSDMVAYFEKLEDLPSKLESFCSSFDTRSLTKKLPLYTAFVFYYFFEQDFPEEVNVILNTFANQGIPQDGKGKRSPAFQLFHWVADKRENRVRLGAHNYMGGLLWALEMTASGTNVNKYKAPRLSAIFWGNDHFGAASVKAHYHDRGVLSDI